MRFLGAFAFVLLISNVANAESPTATCAISFMGTSSLHDFSGTVPAIATRLEPSAGASGKWDVNLSVPVASMNTSNDSRDAKMREMFDAEHSPDIRVALREIDPQAVKQKSELQGMLTIAGRSREFVAKLRNWREDGPDVSFDLTSAVSLAEFGLTAPSVLGLIRVADEVGVTAHVVVQAADILRAPAADPSAPPRNHE